ncbi:reverse transcriptase domain-containing protein [Leptolyngbya sp. AN03gr2]|uniref:reverse transcriptase domain-containing protein n=1 Tax=unclassified Leptolyngbya TaxID=2650499 RepID=UPI003D310A2B
MVRHKDNFSELWKRLPWKQFRRNLFRLQCRLWKAVRAGNRHQSLNLQKLILRSQSARLLAIRQVTQLNAGKKTAGIDGQASLSYRQRWALETRLRQQVNQWQHAKLREIPIPKKDGSTRMLKVPIIADRAWQCLVKYALEPAHEAGFHARSYGFRPGRSAHDAQRLLFNNLRSSANGFHKRILELDIEKCFDRINQPFLMQQIMAPQAMKQALWKCLKAGVHPEFPEQGTPQGGVVSPLLANIALNGIETIHYCIRYADDMVFILKPEDNATELEQTIDEFLAQRGLKVKPEKTKLVTATEGFDFLGWHFQVQSNGKFRSYPAADNYQAFRQRVKAIVNHSNYGAKEKAQMLAPLVRGWRNYHRHCHMRSPKHRLWGLNHRA